MSPTTSLVSADAKTMMLGVAGAKASVLWGMNTCSAFSGVAFENARRRSVNGENIRACRLVSEES